MLKAKELTKRFLLTNVKERPKGLGDVIANATRVAGIKPCSSCEKRREALNRAVPFGKRQT
jgi:hypothetical protein